MASSFTLAPHHRSGSECLANHECPNPREPGERYCVYHLTVEAAKRGDERARRICLERWGLEVVVHA